MADKIIIEYDVEVSKLEAGLNRIEKDLKGVETASTKQSKKTTDNIKKQDKELKNVSKSVSGLSTAFDRLASNLPFAGAIMQTKELASSVLGFGSNAEKAGVKAASGMKLFGNALKATGIGLFISLIAGLISYFKRSDDGATFFAGTMRGLTTVFLRILDPVSKFAKFLVDLVVNTDEAGKAFDGFIEKLKPVGDFFKNIGSSFVDVVSGDFTKGFTKLGDTFTDLFEGVKNTITGAVEVIGDAISQGIDLEARLDANSDAFRDLGVQAAEARIEIDKLFLQGRNRAIEAEKRQGFFLNALEREKALTQATLKLQNEKLNLTREDAISKGIINDESLRSAEAQKRLSEDTLAFEEAVASRRIELTDAQKDAIANVQKEIFATRLEEVKFQEKVINQVSALNDQQIAETLEKQQNLSEKLLLEQEKRLLDGVINERQAQEEILNAQIDGSNKALNEYSKIKQQQYKNADNLRKDDLIDEQQYQSLILGINQNFDKLIIQEKKKIYSAEMNLRTMAIQAEEKALQEQLKIIDDYTKDISLTYKEEQQTQLDTLTLTEKEKVALAKKTQQEILQTEIDGLQAKRQYLEEAGRETIDIDRQIREKQLELKKTYDDKEIDSEKEKQEVIKQLKEKGLQIAEQTFNDLFAASNDNKKQELEAEKQAGDLTLQNQIASLDKQRNAKVISDEKYAQKKAQLEAQQQIREKEFALRQFNFDKQVKLRQLAIETAFGVAKAIASKGIPLGLIEAAAITLQSGIQAGIINSQKPPKFEKGGIIGGKPHSQGGTIIEAEKGEFIINKKATEKYKPLLEEINTNSIRKKSNLVPLLRKSEMSENAQKQLENMMLLKAIQNSTDLSHLERLTKSNKNVKVANSSELAEQIAKRMNTNNSYIK